MESKVLEKIKKLVAKQQSAEEIGSVEEAEIFAAKVQELLMKHNLSMSQIEQDRADGMAEDTLSVKIPSIGGKSNFQIMNAIAKNNWCKCFTLGGTKNFVIVGDKDNVATVKYIHSIVTPVFVNAGKNDYKNDYLPHCTDYKPIGVDTYLRKYILGCASGLFDKLYEERQEMIQEDDLDKKGTNELTCSALIVLNDKAVDNYIGEKHGKLVRGRKTTTSRRANGAYENGYDTGKNVSISAPISAGSNSKKLK